MTKKYLRMARAHLSRRRAMQAMGSLLGTAAFGCGDAPGSDDGSTGASTSGDGSTGDPTTGGAPGTSSTGDLVPTTSGASGDGSSSSGGGENEFDDYIAKPKPNGYQSLHTVVQWADARPVEIQVRTRAMDEHAEQGVAAHWAYKEAGTRGYAGVSAPGSFDARVAEARKAVLRQLLAWERDFAASADAAQGGFDDRIFVFTPQAAVVELPAGATAIDFAYLLHTDLGHRCRGARVDGAMLPLNRPLANGQTVEIVAAQEGGTMGW